MNATETLKVLSVCSAAFPHVAITKETGATYAVLLADLEYRDVAAAVNGILLTSEWFPSIAQIRRVCAAQAGLLAPSAEDAWREVLERATSVGRGGDPYTWSHPVIVDTVATIGWFEICRSENQGVLRAHFGKAYDAKKAAYDRPMLVGQADASHKALSGELTP